MRIGRQLRSDGRAQFQHSTSHTALLPEHPAGGRRVRQSDRHRATNCTLFHQALLVGGCCPLRQAGLSEEEHVDDPRAAPPSGARQQPGSPCCHTSAAAAASRHETIPLSRVVSWRSKVKTDHPSSPEQLCRVWFRPVIDQPAHEMI